MAGWGGNDLAQATDPRSDVDADGDPYDGNARYQVRLATEPPVKAFWSITMYDKSYDGQSGSLVQTPIDRERHASPGTRTRTVTIPRGSTATRTGRYHMLKELSSRALLGAALALPLPGVALAQDDEPAGLETIALRLVAQQEQVERLHERIDDVRVGTLRDRIKALEAAVEALASGPLAVVSAALDDEEPPA